MRKPLAAVFALCVLSLVFVLGPARPARAECTTQGTFALALAQVLKFNATTVADAVAALEALGVAPDGGWKPAECLTPEATAQVRAALDRATKSDAPGAVDRAQSSAVDRALEGLDVPDRTYPVSPHKP